MAEKLKVEVREGEPFAPEALGAWGRAPHFLYQSPLRDVLKSAGRECYLRLLARVHKHTFQCTVLQSELAEELGVTSRYIKQTLKLLTDQGLIRKTRSIPGGHNVYELPWRSEWMTPSKDVTAPPREAQPGVADDAFQPAIPAESEAASAPVAPVNQDAAPEDLGNSSSPPGELQITTLGNSSSPPGEAQFPTHGNSSSPHPYKKDPKTSSKTSHETSFKTGEHAALAASSLSAPVAETVPDASGQLAETEEVSDYPTLPDGQRRITPEEASAFQRVCVLLGKSSEVASANEWTEARRMFNCGVTPGFFISVGEGITQDQPGAISSVAYIAKAAVTRWNALLAGEPRRGKHPPRETPTETRARLLRELQSIRNGETESPLVTKANKLKSEILAQRQRTTEQETRRSNGNTEHRTGEHLDGFEAIARNAGWGDWGR